MTTARQDTRERLARGYADSTPPTKQRPPFLVDHKLERLLEMRDKDPATFAVIGLETRTSLGYYEASRTAAGYTGKETTHDDAA